MSKHQRWLKNPKGVHLKIIIFFGPGSGKIFWLKKNWVFKKKIQFFFVPEHQRWLENPPKKV